MAAIAGRCPQPSQQKGLLVCHVGSNSLVVPLGLQEISRLPGVVCWGAWRNQMDMQPLYDSPYVISLPAWL